MPTITDGKLLQLQEAGLLGLCSDCTVWKYHAGRRCRQVLTPRRMGGIPRREYYIRLGNSRNRRARLSRTITAARLVWLLHHRQPIPAGMEVDHRDHDNSNDHPTNLQLVSGHTNKVRGGGHSVFSFFRSIVAARYGSRGDF
jgi:hypothetical protein